MKQNYSCTGLTLSCHIAEPADGDTMEKVSFALHYCNTLTFVVSLSIHVNATACVGLTETCEHNAHIYGVNFSS